MAKVPRSILISDHLMFKSLIRNPLNLIRNPLNSTWYEPYIKHIKISTIKLEVPWSLLVAILHWKLTHKRLSHTPLKVPIQKKLPKCKSIPSGRLLHLEKATPIRTNLRNYTNGIKELKHEWIKINFTQVQSKDVSLNGVIIILIMLWNLCDSTPIGKLLFED